MVATEKARFLERIENALETVRPHLRVDGGNVEVVDLTDDMQVQIRWTGMCETCGMSAMTLRAGITEAIRGKIPEVREVVPINGR